MEFLISGLVKQLAAIIGGIAIFALFVWRVYKAGANAQKARQTEEALKQHEEMQDAEAAARSDGAANRLRNDTF